MPVRCRVSLDRPHVMISVAMTADGKIDTAERRGTRISSAADLARVDRLRAGVDGVLVGSRTLLNEDPRLTVKSPVLRAQREARGLSPNPAKIAIISVAALSPDSEFLSAGSANVIASPHVRPHLLRCV